VTDPLLTQTDPLATPHQRKEIWATIASLSLADGRFAWVRQALKFAAMDDPPREWPPDSEVARMQRGEYAPPKVSWPKRLAGRLAYKVLVRD
jgi:hypothetical protein